MTTQNPDRVNVRTVHDHVEVTGLNKEAVKYAIRLSQAVVDERMGARSALVSHVHQAILHEGVPLITIASQRQVQRSAELKEQLITTHGAETYASLATRRNTQEGSVRTWVSRQRKRAELFTVELHGVTLIPKVQLTKTGHVDPRIAEMMRPLIDAGLDGWSLWAWLTSPTGLLSGDVPAKVAHSNMGRAHKAASRYASELRQAQSNVA